MSQEFTLSRRDFVSAAVAASTGIVCRPIAVAAAPQEFTFQSAIQAARAIRNGQVSSLELTNYMFDRIERHKSLNAVVTLMKDEALARARQADAARARGESWGPLHGVPCTMKDSFDVKGVRTTAGAPLLKDNIPETDAPVVERLRQAGAVILGMTNVPPLLRDYQSNNTIFGRSNNPWDPDRTPGGSTGGGAAAVAAGIGYIAIGSDIGGSIRVPAHFCGVYGHRSTYGVIPERGHIPPRPRTRPSPPTGFNVVGPLARSADDLALAMEVLGGPDTDAAIAYKWTMPPARKKQLSEYRLGYVIDDEFCPVASDVKVVLQRTVDAFRKAGVAMREGWPAGVNPVDQWRTNTYLVISTMTYEMSDEQIEAARKTAENLDESRATIAARAMTAPHKTFLQMQHKQLEARAVWQQYFREYDAFLMPAAFVSAFPHDSRPGVKRLQTPEGERDYSDLERWIAFATLADLPATVAPVGLTAARLPVGVQILGPHLEDRTPIDIAARMARVIGGFVPPPGF